MKNCKNCSKEFLPKRSTALFCSDACKVAYSRKEKEEPYVRPNADWMELAVIENPAPHISSGEAFDIYSKNLGKKGS